MPWNQLSPMDQRTQFIGEYLDDGLTVVDLCDLFGISRKTGYKWIGRYEREGADGLKARDSRPLSCPHQTAEPLEEALKDARRHHPWWGAKKLLKLVSKAHPDWVWPAPSTVCEILRRHGLVRQPRYRRQRGHPGRPVTVAEGPNDLWCADFKGQFKTLDGVYCYPLTVTDSYSRYLLGCHGLLTNSCAQSRAVFTRLFEEYGLPRRIRTDNGVPFATNTLGRISSLSAWWIRLGIVPELIEPGCPQQNGSHERMHKTLKTEATRPPSNTRRGQQNRFDAFREEFNNVRPHEALGQETPASLYAASPREMPKKLLPLEYESHFEKRLVSGNGGIRWKGKWVNVTSVLKGDYIGLEEIDNGVWNVFFGQVKLGRLLEEHMQIQDLYGKLKRRHIV